MDFHKFFSGAFIGLAIPYLIKQLIWRKKVPKSIVTNRVGIGLLVALSVFSIGLKLEPKSPETLFGIVLSLFLNIIIYWDADETAGSKSAAKTTTAEPKTKLDEAANEKKQNEVTLSEQEKIEKIFNSLKYDEYRQIRDNVTNYIPKNISEENINELVKDYIRRHKLN